jgi:hypothetical protein
MEDEVSRAIYIQIVCLHVRECLSRKSEASTLTPISEYCKHIALNALSSLKYPEDGTNKIFRNDNSHLPDYTVYNAYNHKAHFRNAGR